MSRRGFSCKVVFLGDTAVGKSCLTVRFVRNEYFEFQEPTIGAAFLAKNIEYQESWSNFSVDRGDFFLVVRKLVLYRPTY